MPKPEFTWASVITFIRGGLALMFLVRYAIHPSVLLAFGIGAMEMLDLVDGWVARRFNQSTDFGRWLDAVFDKIVLFGVLGVLIWYLRTDPWLYLIVAIIAPCDLAIALIARRKEKAGIKLKPTKDGKHGMFLRNSATILLLMYVATEASGMRPQVVFASGAGGCAAAGVSMGFRALQSYRKVAI
jgi:cardiolipin synthase